MSKFNVGDRVVLVRAEGMAAVQGATATVVESKWSAFTYVKWDRNSAAGRQSDGGYEHDRFQKIEPKKPRQSKPKASDTKIAKLRSHLLAGRSITQLEAIALYSAFRLAARICFSRLRSCRKLPAPTSPSRRRGASRKVRSVPSCSPTSRSATSRWRCSRSKTPRARPPITTS